MHELIHRGAFIGGWSGREREREEERERGRGGGEQKRGRVKRGVVV